MRRHRYTRAEVVRRFLAGASMVGLARYFGRTRDQIEAVIREATRR